MKIEKIAADIEDSKATGHWPTRKSRLCDWCAHQKSVRSSGYSASAATIGSASYPRTKFQSDATLAPAKVSMTTLRWAGTMGAIWGTATTHAPLARAAVTPVGNLQE